MDNHKKFTPEDEHLKLLIEVYSGVTGLPGNMNRYSKLVLYKDEEKGTYEIHTYEGVDSYTGSHSGYEADADYAVKILEAVKRDNIIALKASDETQSCNRTLVLRLADTNGNLVRLSSEDGEFREAHSKLGIMLRAGIHQEKRIVPEYAENWKSIYACSSGMSMKSNYRFTLERSEEGIICISNDSISMNSMTGMMGMMNVQNNVTQVKNMIPISEEDSNAINCLRLGLMGSLIKPEPKSGTMGGGFMMAMSDGGEKHLYVTYSDDRRDEKMADDAVMSSLFSIVEKYL